jgi:hypothetical protein
VFKKYSQMKLQMKREALQKLNRKANQGEPGLTRKGPTDGFCHGFATVGGFLARFGRAGQHGKFWKWFKIKSASQAGRVAQVDRAPAF